MYSRPLNNEQLNQITTEVMKVMNSYFSHEQLASVTQKTLEKSKKMNLSVSIAVVDVSGHLLYFYRDPNSILISLELAQKKAYSAISLQKDTIDLAKLTAPNKPLYQIESSSDGKIVSFGGGVLIKDSKMRLQGAVGVSGASDPKDDHILAKYFSDELIK